MGQCKVERVKVFSFSLQQQFTKADAGFYRCTAEDLHGKQMISHEYRVVMEGNLYYSWSGFLLETNLWGIKKKLKKISKIIFQSNCFCF
jgi:hypothetical protein